MDDRVFNVLFLCTGNSARSIMGEALLNKDGRGRFKAYSAGQPSQGGGEPICAEGPCQPRLSDRWLVLKAMGRVREPGAPVMDFVFTVCDDAAGEVCPVWPGQPMTAHWGIEDPAKVEGTDIQKEAAFVQALRYLKTRIGIFTNLPMRGLSALSLQNKLHEIGEMEGATRARARMPQAS